MQKPVRISDYENEEATLESENANVVSLLDHLI
jgi:hypothetical protein